MMNGEEVFQETPLKFPITPVGESSIVKLLIENNSEDDIELLPFVEDKEVVIECKKYLKPRESYVATYTFSPSQSRTHSLNTPIGFREFIG